MSNHASHHDEPHVTPLWVYLSVGLALLVLTILTVTATTIDLGHDGNLIVAMVIATIKAGLVILFFMHLLYDSKLYSIVFSVGLFMLGVFIILTMFDTERRGDIYEYTAGKIQPRAAFYDSLKADGHGAHGEEGAVADSAAAIVDSLAAPADSTALSETAVADTSTTPETSTESSTEATH